MSRRPKALLDHGRSCLYEAATTTIVDKDLIISSKTAGNQCVVLSTTAGRVLDVTNNAEVTLFNLKVSGGDASTGRGGGIYTPGDIVVLNSFVRDNSATERGGGLRVRYRSSGNLCRFLRRRWPLRPL